jgi:hypothetical protein
VPRPARQHQLPLAQRQLACVSPEQVPETHAIDRRRHGRPVRGPGSPQGRLVRQPAEGDHLLDPHRERQRGLLRHDGQPARDLGPVQRRQR